MINQEKKVDYYRCIKHQSQKSKRTKVNSSASSKISFASNANTLQAEDVIAEMITKHLLHERNQHGKQRDKHSKTIKEWCDMRKEYLSAKARIILQLEQWCNEEHVS